VKLLPLIPFLGPTAGVTDRDPTIAVISVQGVSPGGRTLVDSTGGPRVWY